MSIYVYMVSTTDQRVLAVQRLHARLVQRVDCVLLGAHTRQGRLTCTRDRDTHFASSYVRPCIL